MEELIHHLDTFQLTYFSAVLLTVSLATAVHILLNQHEEPVSTTLWLFVVFTFPLVGLVCYLFFGINRMQTRGLRIRLAHELMHGERNDPMHRGLAAHLTSQRQHALSATHPAYGEYQLVLDRLLPETRPLTGNQVEVLQDGTTVYPRMLAEIMGAQSAIHLQSFIIVDDAAGAMLMAALAEKARQGVQVKVLYDRFGSFTTMFSQIFRRFTRNLPNLEIRPFSQLSLGAPWRVQLRNHRKLLIIDGRTAFIGGINISSNNDLRLTQAPRHIHDLHCLIRGPAVGELQFSFLRDWQYVSGTPPSALFLEQHFPVLESAGATVVRVVASGPGQEYEATAKVFHTAAAMARHSLWIVNPYFVPDRAYWNALGMAVARGVEVRVVVPEHNNHWYVRYATKNLFRLLLPRGVRIFEKGGVFSHAKAVLVDNEWGYMGSSNCDVRSFRLNYELDFVGGGDEFTATLREQFLAELVGAREVTLAELEQTPWPRRLLENFCALLTPVL